MSAPRLAIAGIHGHGHTHVDHAIGLDRLGELYFSATIDPVAPGEVYDVGHPVSHYTSLHDCLIAEEIDVVILCTPISTHFDLASRALRHGLDVLLEKPTTVSLESSRRLAAVAHETGRLLQVGFQSLGSGGIQGIRDILATGRIGEATAVSIVGQWVRGTAYWERSKWAGRREVGGVATVDGVITNPFAHSFATALAILGQGNSCAIHDVGLDQYHVNDIEADDTSAIHLRTGSGVLITAGLTLCGSDEIDPLVRIHTTQGSIWFSYTTDTGTLRGADGRVVQDLSFDRTLLLDNLLATRRGTSSLLVPVEATYGFMSILDAVRTAPAPLPVDPRFVEWRDDHFGHHPVLADVDTWVWRVADRGKTFKELGAPWTVSPS